MNTTRVAPRLAVPGTGIRSATDWGYCWEVDGRVTAVLHTGPIDSPLMAVRASIMEETEGN